MNLFPHTVTLYRLPRTQGESAHATVLEGVLLDESRAASASAAGLGADDEARLFIPFGVTARAVPEGTPRHYLPPEDFEKREDKSGFWSVGDRRDWAFVKGTAGAAVPEERSGCRVYAVRRVAVRDFGGLKHWEIGGV